MWVYYLNAHKTLSPSEDFYTSTHSVLEGWRSEMSYLAIRKILPKINYTRFLERKIWNIQWVYCTTWPTVARAGETHLTFTAFPLSFPCDAHILHLSSLVWQSDLCSRPVHTWIKLRSVYFCLQCLQNAYVYITTKNIHVRWGMSLLFMGQLEN